MPLPQEVINRLSEERPPTEGWSAGLLGFAAAVFAITVVLYAGIAFVYEPTVNKQTAAASDQLARMSQSIAPSSSANLVNFYSQLVHVKALLGGRTALSPLLAWLSKNTEINIYYSSLSFSSGNQVSLTMLGRSQNDIDQQIAIFEADPNVQSVNVSSVSIASISGYLQANISLTVKPALLTAAVGQS